MNSFLKQLLKKSVFFAVSALIVVSDRISKDFFEDFLSGVEGNSVKALGDEFARFTLAYNEGIAFSIRLGGRYFLSAVSFIASLVIIYVIIKTDIRKRVEIWGLSFILGGAVGNMIDRVRTGRVIDFIDCDFPDFIMQRWPIFNIADSFVTTGMVFLVVHYMFLEKKPGIRE
jgi:signal peptidase II